MGKRNRNVEVSGEVAAVEVSGEVSAVETPKAPKGRAVKMNGVVYAFGERKPLKRAHAGVAATIDGAAGTAVVIPARNFSDTRVWVTLGDGTVGRFLVPPGVDVADGVVIESTTETVAYNREALRTKTETRVRKVAADEGAEGDEGGEAAAEGDEVTEGEIEA